MKFDSPLFDRIRVKPDQDRRLRADDATCEWPGCTCGATYRAPKGRQRENEYWRFCLDHVREYNHSYNFFAGMNDEYANWFPTEPPSRYVAKLGVEIPGVLVSIRMTAFLG